MANDSKIVITAGLQIPETVSTIKDDLGSVSKELNAKQALKVTCYIDTKNISGLQKQLSEASKNLKINLPEISTSGTSKATKNITDETVKQFNDVFSMVGKMGDMTKKEFNAQTKQMLKDFKAAWETGMATGDTNPYYQMLDKLGQRISEFSKGDVQKLRDAIAEIRRAFTDGSVVSVGESLMKELENATGSRGSAREYLDAIYGRGNYTVSKGNAGYDTLFSRDEDVVESILKAGQTIIEYQNKIKSVGWGLDEVQEIGATAQEIGEHIEDALRKLTGLPQIDRSGEWVEIFNPEEVQEYTQEVQRAGEALHQAFGDPSEYTEILSANDIAQTEQNIVALANGMRTIEELKNKFSSDSTVKGISADWAKDAEGNLTGFAVNIKKATGEVEKFKYEVQELNQVKLLGSTGSDRGVAKMQQDVAKLQKDLANFESSHKSIESGLTEPLKEAREAVDRFANGDGSVEEAQKALDNLKTAAANIGVSLKSLGASFNIFDNAVNKAKNFDNTLKSLQADINVLSNESAKSTLSGSLAGATQSLAELQQIESTSGRGLEWSKKYGEVSLAIQEITNGLKAARNEEKALSRGTSLSNKIKKLSADMQAYAAANKRAIDSTKQMSDGTTFMAKWEDLTSRMAKGSELSADELKHLGEEFRIFGKEAEAAGLKGDSAWQKFLNSFKVMSSYITANMVFNFVKRQLRDMVNEVTAVDTAMTELRKVTEATDAEFEAFTRSAGQTGRTLGASVSDVINATSTFSRAGYNLPDAEELGRIATLYKNVGDGIDIDSASQSLISVMKAFNIEAKDSIRIIDKINSVSNQAAIDSGGLGLALQRVASAMDAANNSLDETIALTTTSNEVVQQPEMVSQGWRTVALRIRGAKSELEDAGLETEGMVESTAKLRDLIKGISGVDIMIDENNFKSTYQIISELGKVWDSISDIDQASLLEAIAGRFYLNAQKCA